MHRYGSLACYIHLNINLFFQVFVSYEINKKNNQIVIDIVKLLQLSAILQSFFLINFNKILLDDSHLNDNGIYCSY